MRCMHGATQEAQQRAASLQLQVDTLAEATSIQQRQVRDGELALSDAQRDCEAEMKERRRLAALVAKQKHELLQMKMRCAAALERASSAERQRVEALNSTGMVALASKMKRRPDGTATKGQARLMHLAADGRLVYYKPEEPSGQLALSEVVGASSVGNAGAFQVTIKDQGMFIFDLGVEKESDAAAAKDRAQTWLTAIDSLRDEAQVVGAVKIQGSLRKAPVSSPGRWQTRLFILEYGKLSYYDAEASDLVDAGALPPPKDAFLVTGGKVTVSTEELDGRSWCFELRVPERAGRVYKLQAESAEECARWTEALRLASGQGESFASEVAKAADEADAAVADLSSVSSAPASYALEPASDLEAERTKAGFLWKKPEGSFMGRWRKRWFVLNARELAYYESSSARPEEHKGSIALDGCSVECIEESGRPSGCCIAILPPAAGGKTKSSRKYVLEAADEQSKFEWIDALLEAIEAPSFDYADGALPTDGDPRV